MWHTTGPKTNTTHAVPQAVSDTPVKCAAFFFQALSGNSGRFVVGLDKTIRANPITGPVLFWIAPPSATDNNGPYPNGGQFNRNENDLSLLFVDVQTDGEGYICHYYVAEEG